VGAGRGDLQLPVLAYVRGKVWGEVTVRRRWVETGVQRWGLELRLCLARYARGVAGAGRWRARRRAWTATERQRTGL